MQPHTTTTTTTPAPDGQWAAAVAVTAKRSHVVGNYPSEALAAKAHDLAARRIFGDSAHTNFT